MTYGIPGSYEGHIDGVDIDMKKNSQKFNYHKDISLLGFHIFDIDQRYISYKHTEVEKAAQKPSVIMNQDILTIQSGFRGSNRTIGSLFKFKSRTGFPIFPPNLTLILFFFNTCSRILHVVDFPFVPVRTIDFIFGLKR